MNGEVGSPGAASQEAWSSSLEADLARTATDLEAADREVRAARAYLHATLERRNEARVGRAQLVQVARDSGLTWRQIGAALGVSIPRVRAIYANAPTPGGADAKSQQH